MVRRLLSCSTIGVEVDWSYLADDHETIAGTVAGHGFTITNLGSAPVISFGEWSAAATWRRQDADAEVTLDGYGTLDPVPWLISAHGSVPADTARAAVEQGDERTPAVLVTKSGAGRSGWIGFVRNEGRPDDTLVTLDERGRELHRSPLGILDRLRRDEALTAERDAHRAQATWRDALLPAVPDDWSIDAVRLGRLSNTGDRFSGLEVHARRDEPVGHVVIALEWWRDHTAAEGPSVFEHRVRNFVWQLQRQGHLSPETLISLAPWLEPGADDDELERAESMLSVTAGTCTVAGQLVGCELLTIDHLAVSSIALQVTTELVIEVTTWGVEPTDAAEWLTPATGAEIASFTSLHRA